MTWHASKNSLYENYTGEDYGANNLLGLDYNIDEILKCSYDPTRNITNTDKSVEHSKLLGLTTSSINGLPGINGLVTTCVHKLSSQVVAVKRYKLDGEYNDHNSCHTSQEKFNEDVKFIMVISTPYPTFLFLI